MAGRKEGPPSTLRRGYGFQQAKSAGAPYVPTRPAWQMSFDVKWRHAEKELRRIVDTDPSLGPVVRELVARQKANDQYNAEYILFDVFSLKPGLTPAGFQDPRPLWARAKWVKDSPQSK